MKKVLIVILILAIASGGVVSALYTKVWNPEWNPFKLSPEEVLSEMTDKMEDLNSFHADVNLAVGGASFNLSGVQGNLDLGLDLSLDVDKEDIENMKSKGNVDVSLKAEGISVTGSLGLIGIGNELYLKLDTIPNIGAYSLIFNQLKGQWIKIDQETLDGLSNSYISTEGLSNMNEQKEMEKELIDLFTGRKFYEVKEELKSESISGEMTYHYLVSLDKEEIKMVIPEMIDIIGKYSEVSEGETEKAKEELPDMIDEFFEKMGDFDAEVWIGQKDYYLYKMEIDKEIDFSEFGNSAPDGTLSFSLGMVLSEFDKDFVIEPPQDYRNFQEIMSEIMMNLFMQPEMNM